MRRVVVLAAAAWVVVISPASALLLARRAWLQRAPLLLPGSALAADLPAQQATGNVRDGADIDAAIGITWGGRERCDANNPLCGPDGQLLAEAPTSWSQRASWLSVQSAAKQRLTVTRRWGMVVWRVRSHH